LNIENVFIYFLWMYIITYNYQISLNIYPRFLESLKIVRRKHCVAFRRSTEAGLRRPTQLDMALAQFGFVGYTMISSDYLGINATDEEMEGVVHLWRVIGSMLGMDDRFIIFIISLFPFIFTITSNK